LVSAFFLVSIASIGVGIGEYGSHCVFFVEMKYKQNTTINRILCLGKINFFQQKGISLSAGEQIGIFLI
jgi:hypothetical protein